MVSNDSTSTTVTMPASLGPIPTDSRLATLVALRDDLAGRIPYASDKDASTMTRQIIEVMTEIEKLQPEVVDTELGTFIADTRREEEGRGRARR